MRPRPAPKKVTQRTSGRKRTPVDYSQFDVTSDDPPSPPKKKRSVDLKRKPSASRIAAGKFKMKPSNSPRPTRTRTAARTPATMTVATTSQSNIVASTSRMLTAPATQQQMVDVLKQLSNMDNIPEDDPNNDTFLPIVPQVQQPPPTVPKVEKPTESDVTVPMLPRVIGTAIKSGKHRLRPHLNLLNLRKKCSKPWNINLSANMLKHEDSLVLGATPVSHRRGK